MGEQALATFRKKERYDQAFGLPLLHPPRKLLRAHARMPKAWRRPKATAPLVFLVYGPVEPPQIIIVKCIAEKHILQLFGQARANKDMTASSP